MRTLVLRLANYDYLHRKLAEQKNIEDSDALEENKEFKTIEEFWRFEDALSADERRAR
jgi:hypothetical protein